MADQEKLMEGLRHCATDEPCFKEKYMNCPYRPTDAYDNCAMKLSRDVLEMVQAQQPRVLTLDEADEADICWLEVIGVKRIIPCRISVFEVTATVHKLIANAEGFVLSEYGEVWRCWSARPSNGQRKAAKWK